MGQINPKSWLGHRVRETLTHLTRCRQPAHLPRVMFMVDNSPGGSSAGIRGWNLAKALRPLGWRTSVIHHQCELIQRRRLVALEKPDLIYLQSARHSLNRPEYYPNTPCVFDLDDADYLDPKLIDHIKRCAQDSIAAIGGSQTVSNWLAQYNDSVTTIWSGTQAPPQRSTQLNQQRSDIVSWACSDPMSYPAEANLIQQVLLKAAQQRSFQFWLFGVNEQTKADLWLQPLRDSGIKCKTFGFLNYTTFKKQLQNVAIGLAPLLPDQSEFSQGKSFGKVLAYLHADVAIIASNTADHPLFFKDSQNGYLPNTPEAWSQNIIHLLNNPQQRGKLTDQANQDFHKHLTIDVAAAKTDQLLRRLIHPPSPPQT